MRIFIFPRRAEFLQIYIQLEIIAKLLMNFFWVWKTTIEHLVFFIYLKQIRSSNVSFIYSQKY